MSELRKDPIVPRWVVMAPERAKRPIELQPAPMGHQAGFDPFAEGNEHETPDEILACRDEGTQPDEPGWRVRVIPNKYPALRDEGEMKTVQSGLFEAMSGIGAHEVIIECTRNETNLSRLSIENIREVVWVYRERLRDLKRDCRHVHATIFKNKGLFAGASLPHSHSQLIATPVIPISIQEELAGSRDYFQRTGRSIFDVLIEEELSARNRIVFETPNFLAVCPYASRFPFEVCILPKKTQSHFESIADDVLEELSMMLKTVLRKHEVALDDPAYNYVIHTAPFREEDLPYYSWQIEILPRTTQVAGFEWGSGFYINPVFPERAAETLRNTSIESSIGLPTIPGSNA